MSLNLRMNEKRYLRQLTFIIYVIIIEDSWTEIIISHGQDWKLGFFEWLIRAAGLLIRESFTEESCSIILGYFFLMQNNILNVFHVAVGNPRRVWAHPPRTWV